MSNFCPDQGRTRVYGEAYLSVRRNRKPAENAEKGKKGHLFMGTNQFGTLDSEYVRFCKSDIGWDV